MLPATVVVKGLPQKTTEGDLYQILIRGSAQTMMDMFGHEGLLVYDSKLFFEYRGILGVTGGLFSANQILDCFLVGTGVVVAVMMEKIIVGCCLEMDLSGRVGYSSASQAGASTVKPLLQPSKSDVQNY
ncbi:hypothetical protein OROHE_016879 [Orobanche hederae]